MLLLKLTAKRTNRIIPGCLMGHVSNTRIAIRALLSVSTMSCSVFRMACRPQLLATGSLSRFLVCHLARRPQQPLHHPSAWMGLRLSVPTWDRKALAPQALCPLHISSGNSPSLRCSVRPQNPAGPSGRWKGRWLMAEALGIAGSPGPEGDSWGKRGHAACPPGPSVK